MLLLHQKVLNLLYGNAIWLKEKLFQKKMLFNELKRHDKILMMIKKFIFQIII
jgi:hypothetical protein